MIINIDRAVGEFIIGLWQLGVVWLIFPIIPILIYMRMENGYWGDTPKKKRQG